MDLRGTAWKFGDNVDTDVITPGRYLNIGDPAELARHCMEDIDKTFARKGAADARIIRSRDIPCHPVRRSSKGI